MPIPKKTESHSVAEILTNARSTVFEIEAQNRKNDQDKEDRINSLNKDIQAQRQAVAQHYSQQVNSAVAEFETARDATNHEIQRLRGQYSQLEKQLEKAVSDWEHESFATRHSRKKKEEYEDTVASLQERMAKVGMRIGQEQGNIKRMEQHRDSRVEEAHRVQQESLAAIDSQGRERKAEIEKRAERVSNDLRSSSIQTLQRLISPGLIDALNAERTAATIDLAHYVPQDINEYAGPDLFHLGSLCTTTIGQQSLGTTLAKEAIANSEVVIGSGANLQFKLPAIVNLSEGLRLVMSTSGGGDRGTTDRCIRNLALRLLLSYPLTKLQLAMVDPQKNGQTFTGIPGLVDRAHESIINGGVKVEEKDIEELMSSLRARQQSYNENYGPTNREGYFLREAVQAVFINDFPSGFTRPALSNLAKLMEAGRAYGMIFVIGVNKEHAKNVENNPDYKRVMNDPDAWYIDMPQGTCRGKELKLIVDDDHKRINEAGGVLLDFLRNAISNASARTEHFEALHANIKDENSWRKKSSLDGLQLAIGVAGAQGPSYVTFGRAGADTRHHGLVAGPTGSGKTNLLHALIMSTMLDYSAEEAQLVLIDFKEGVEFRQYAGRGIPSLRSITVSTQPEFALAALRDVETEFKHRMAVGMNNYREYRLTHADEFMPRSVVVFDEVQELFGPDVRPELRADCARILKLLVEQGRAAGIHVVLASQSFARISEINPLLVNMAVRVVVKDAGDGGILAEASELEDSPQGYAILNDKRGDSATGNQLIQIPKFDDTEREELLEGLSEQYRLILPELAGRFGGTRMHTRLLFENVEDDPEHPFTQLAETCDDITTTGLERRFGETPIITLGSVLSVPGRENPYALAGRRYDLDLYENLLLVGKESTIATKVFIDTVLSTCLDNLCRIDGSDNKPARDRVIAMNFGESSNLASLEMNEHDASDGKEVGLDCIYEFEHVEHVSTAMGGRRRRGTRGPAKSEVETIVEELYALLQERKAQVEVDPDATFDDVIVLMYGFDNATVFTNAGIHDLGAGMTSIERLRKLLSEGIDYDIFFVVWSQTLAAVDRILGYGDGSLSALSAFRRRMAFACSKDDLVALTNLDESPATSQGVAFYDATTSDRLYLCPYTLPRPDWFDDFRDAYEDLFEKTRAKRFV